MKPERASYAVTNYPMLGHGSTQPLPSAGEVGEERTGREGSGSVYAKVLIATILIVSAGCSKQAAPSPAATNGTPLTQKLQGMTPEQRTEYVKSHMDEVAAAGSMGVPHKKS